MAEETKPVEVPKEEAPAATAEATATETPAVAAEATEEAAVPAGMSFPAFLQNNLERL